MSSGSTLPSPPEIKHSEFQQLREFVHSTFGLDLRDGKQPLVCSRLNKHLRAGGFRSFQDYLRHVRNDRTGESLSQLIDALTTNHTSFLREPEHFRFLTATAMPRWRTRKSVSIWSAASSTGEEPWSILFTLLDAVQVPGSGPEIRILATDISTRVLKVAREGVYALDRLRTLPPMWLQKYFHRVGRNSSEYQVRQEYRTMVEFRRLNLIEQFPFSATYAAIFCRNVMIYFDRDTQTSLVRRLAGVLEPGGYLFAGHSESLTGIDQPLRYICPATYQKTGHQL